MSGDTQVLEFELESERYCVDIGAVAEVVRRREDAVAQVPNSAPHVDGVMDLRGETTKIVDPRKLFETDHGEDAFDGRHVIVFDESVSAESMGWVVNEVDRVSRVSPENVDEVADDRAINGIVNREDGFLVWTSPDVMPG